MSRRNWLMQNEHASILGPHRRSAQGIAGLACLAILALSVPLQAGVWDMDLPLPNSDPAWNTVKALWARQADGRNLDELIAALTPLKAAQPDKLEPFLWLARVHYLHARYESSERREHFELSERYARQALERDPRNVLAAKILFETLGYSRDREYIMQRYGALLKSLSPLPIGEALPAMNDSPRWDTFQKLWEVRTDVAQARAALVIMETIARENPGNGLAQVWLSRGYCYIGESYTSQGQFADGLAYFQKGIQSGEKALGLLPGYVPAHYWYQLNLADSLRKASFMTMARSLKPLLTNLLLCSRENTFYFCLAPVQVLAGMIVAGGWVTEQGMRLAGITTAMDLNALEMGEILYPDCFALAFNRANMLAYKGKHTEALAILEKLLVRNPDVIACIAPENRNTLRNARRLYDQLKHPS